jgi:hypothetical protein
MPIKSISFAKVMKKAPNPPLSLTRGRKLNLDQIGHEATTNVHLGCYSILKFILR